MTETMKPGEAQRPSHVAPCAACHGAGYTVERDLGGSWRRYECADCRGVGLEETPDADETVR